jgi:hypothetical protein
MKRLWTNHWHGWAQMAGGQHYHLFAGRTTLCGLAPRPKQRLLNPSTGQGWSVADCPNCHRVLRKEHP